MLARFAGSAGGVAMTSDKLDELRPYRAALFAEILRSPVTGCDFPELGKDTQIIVQRVQSGDVTILADHYEDDWRRLSWIRLRGLARVLDDGEERSHAIELLAAKYEQYREHPPDGPVLAVDVTEVRSWSA